MTNVLWAARGNADSVAVEESLNQLQVSNLERFILEFSE
jgi:hypothetical protein